MYLNIYMSLSPSSFPALPLFPFGVSSSIPASNFYNFQFVFIHITSHFDESIHSWSVIGLYVCTQVQVIPLIYLFFPHLNIYIMLKKYYGVKTVMLNIILKYFLFEKWHFLGFRTNYFLCFSVKSSAVGQLWMALKYR